MADDAVPATRIPGWAKLVAAALGLLVVALAILLYRSGKPGEAKTSPEDIPSLTAIKDTIHNIPGGAPVIIQKAPANISIDGSLGEWKLNEKNSFTTWPSTKLLFSNDMANWSDAKKDQVPKLLKEYYSFQGAMMEDTTNLYIAAKIGDPLNLIINNNKPPKTPDLDAKGSTVPVPDNYLQIRYSSDSAQRNPLAAADQETLQRAIQVHLWHSTTTGRAYLGVRMGLTPNEGKLTLVSGERGFECVFKQVENDCYIEAKIPWAVLEKRPSPDIDEFRCIWQAIRQIPGVPGNRLRLFELTDPTFQVNDANGPTKATDIELLGANKGVSLWGKAIRPK